MEKIICDICKTNEAAEHFRVQRLKKYTFVWGSQQAYENIDICKECYDNLTAHLPEPEPTPLYKLSEAMKRFRENVSNVFNPDTLEGKIIVYAKDEPKDGRPEKENDTGSVL